MRFSSAIVLAIVAVLAASSSATPVEGSATDKCVTWCFGDGACAGCEWKQCFWFLCACSIAVGTDTRVTSNILSSSMGRQENIDRISPWRSIVYLYISAPSNKNTPISPLSESTLTFDFSKTFVKISTRNFYTFLILSMCVLSAFGGNTNVLVIVPVEIRGMHLAGYGTGPGPSTEHTQAGGEYDSDWWVYM
ncbi:hypothetical protein C8R48DRAFT_671960 [Suillus tomentosus]|nr:hypothetical protein C8R48DRAFT_671960 [Suillus tomentosus]